MRQRAVIGNWKMHGSIQSVRNLMVEIMDGILPMPGELEVALCPSFIHLDLVGNLLRDSGSRIKLGEQDAHSPMDSGAAFQEKQPDLPVHGYAADNGFNCDQRDSYDAPAASQARESGDCP